MRLGRSPGNGVVMELLIRQSTAGLSTPLCRYVKSFRAVEKLRDEQWWQETLQPLRPQLASSAHRASSSLPSSRKAQALPASKVLAAPLLVLHYAAFNSSTPFVSSRTRRQKCSALAPPAAGSCLRCALLCASNACILEYCRDAS